MSKGSTRRPAQVSEQQVAANWEKAFGPKKNRAKLTDDDIKWLLKNFDRKGWNAGGEPIPQPKKKKRAKRKTK